MSEVKAEVKEEAKAEVKVEVKAEVKVEVKEALGFSPFVTEKDRFDIKVTCYKDKDILVVKGVDAEFEPTKDGIKEIKFTFKHVSQGDFNIISTQGGILINEDDTPNHISLNKLEFARLIVLIREWSLPEELSNVNIVDLDPKIVKSVIFQLREKIGLNGIL